MSKIYGHKEGKIPLNITSSDIAKQKNTVSAHLIILYLSTIADHSLNLMKDNATAGLQPLTVIARKHKVT